MEIDLVVIVNSMAGTNKQDELAESVNELFTSVSTMIKGELQVLSPISLTSVFWIFKFVTVICLINNRVFTSLCTASSVLTHFIRSRNIIVEYMFLITPKICYMMVQKTVAQLRGFF